MKIVVTGASGFLGRAVVKRLATTDAVVVPVSRREIPGGVHVFDYTGAPGGDVLIHLAEAAHRGIADRAGDAYEAEAGRLADALFHDRYQRVIYASSALLYGDGDADPHRPQDPVRVTDTYTRVKRRAEQVVLDSRNGIVARLTNLFGPGMSEDNVLSTILRQVPGVDPICVRAAGPVRDFLWVEDAADALALMAAGLTTGVFNVGSGVGRSVGDIARIVLETAGQGDRAILETEPGGRASHLIVDISETVSTWQWSPATPFQRGILQLLNSTIHG